MPAAGDPRRHGDAPPAELRREHAPGGTDGEYSLTTAQDATLQYRSGVTYDFRAALGNETFTARVEQVPALELVNGLHPAAGYILQGAGQPLTLTRPPAPAGIERPLGFVTVVPVSRAGKGAPTWSNVPETPLDFLRLYAMPGGWKSDDITIPGSAFPRRGSTTW